MNTISKTLLYYLFENKEYTTPQEKIYSFVKGRIFPGADDYIHFLELSDLNEKREVAKKIIKRLCMFSNYQPPYEIIENISQQEKSEKNQSIDKNYIPQDHFVHIISVYIFGVYLYFKHPSSARELNLLFSDKRKGDNYLRKINAVNDFISSWKSFCLYHDIGYPFEIYYGKENTLTSTEKQDMEVFDNVYEHWTKQLSIKALAKLVVVNSMIKEVENIKSYRNVSDILCYNFDPIICNEESPHAKFEGDGYYELEDVYSYDHLKMFLGFIEQSNVMEILFCRVLGHPVAFSYTNEKEVKSVYKNVDIMLTITDEELKSIFRHDDMAYDSKFKHDYELKYYIKNLSTFGEKLEYSGASLDDRISVQDLDNILELVKEEKKIQLDFKHINSEYDLDNLIFEVYEAITTMLKMHLLSFDAQEKEDLTICKFKKIYLTIRQTIYQNYIKEKITEEIKGCVTTALTNHDAGMKELGKKLSEINLSEDNFYKLISEFINDVFKENELKNIIQHIVNQMVETLQTKIARHNSLVWSYAKIFNIIYFNCNEIKNNELIFDNNFDIQSLLKSAMKNKRMDTEYQDIKKNMLDKKCVSVEDLIATYQRYTKYDHGICSGAIYLYINSITSFFAEKINHDTNKFTEMLTPLFWAINPKLLSQKLLSKYIHIRKETFHAIFCHNVFANRANELFKNLRDYKKWTTRIDNDAFLYFCMLCDSLQHWERERYYDPRIIDYNPLFAMDSYNVSIKNDKITIKTVAYANYDDILKKFNHDDFLEDCSKYLSLEIRPK